MPKHTTTPNQNGYLDLSNNYWDASSLESYQAQLSSKGVKQIELNDNPLGDEGGIALANIIRQSSTLEILSANGCCIGEKGFTALSEAIAQSESLKFIDFSYNNLTDQAINYFAQCLKQYRKVPFWHINFAMNSLSDACMQPLAEAAAICPISYLDLNTNYYITDEGAKRLLNYATNTMIINLDDTEVSEEMRAKIASLAKNAPISITPSEPLFGKLAGDSLSHLFNLKGTQPLSSDLSSDFSNGSGPQSLSNGH